MPMPGGSENLEHSPASRLAPGEAAAPDIVGLKVRSALVITAIVAGLMGIDAYLEIIAGYYVLVFATMWLGMWEFYELSRAKGARPMAILGIVSATCLLVVQIACIRTGTPLTYALPGTGVAVVLITLIGHMFTSRTEGYFSDLGATVLGLMYVWFLGAFFFIGLRHLENGFATALMMFIAVKVCDIMAYVIGRKIGRHKLVPHISPGKSFEGAVAGISGAVLVSVLLNRVIQIMTLHQALLFGLIVGIAGILGDLIESDFKRSAGIKDSSRLIASYGGMLDLIDSLLVAAPVTYFLMLVYGR